MLQPDFDPAPTTVRVHRSGYASKCKARDCLTRATLVAEKVDGAGATFTKSNYARGTAKLSLSASVPAALRFASAEANSAHELSESASNAPIKRKGPAANRPLGARGS